MERWAVFAALFLSALPLASGAASPDQGLPASAATAITRLGNAAVHERRTPGLAIAIVANGRVVYARGFGTANLAKKLPVAGDTEFYAGELTHQFVAAAALMLVQDGKLKLDDPVTKYLPELTAASGVTVNQLLLQTSGLPTYPAAPRAELERSQKPAAFVAALNALGPATKPGTAYADNPANYRIAGMVVEKAAGEPLSDVLQQRIFEPLVMNRTFLAGDTGISPTRATGYTHQGDGFIALRGWDPAWLAGDRGLVSTVYDLAKWDIEMPVLLREDAMRTMLTPNGLPGASPVAMGWIVDRHDGKNLDWLAGQVPGYQSANAILPDAHMAVIVLANADELHGGRVFSAGAFANHVIDIVSPPSAAQLDNAIVTRAREWLTRLSAKDIDRTQLTPAFSKYLSDAFVARTNFAALGKLQSIVPVSSATEPDGDTVYVFLVQYPHARYHYHFALTKDGKIDGLELTS